MVGDIIKRVKAIPSSTLIVFVLMICLMPMYVYMLADFIRARDALHKRRYEIAMLSYLTEHKCSRIGTIEHDSQGVYKCTGGLLSHSEIDRNVEGVLDNERR